MEEGPATPRAGAHGHGGRTASSAQPEPDGGALVLHHPRQKLQNPSQERSQDVSVPGGVTGPRKASARVGLSTFRGGSRD